MGRLLSSNKAWFIFGLLIALILSLPLIIKQGVIYGLQQQGWQNVELEKVEFRPISGQLALHNLRYQSAEDKHYHLNYFFFDMSWLELFSKRIYIEDVQVSGLLLSVEKQAEYVQINGLKIPAQTAEEQQTADSESDWQFGIKQLSIRDFSLSVKLPELQEKLTLKELQVSDLLQWQPQKLALAKLELDLGENAQKGQLSANLRMTPFTSQPKLSGTLQVNAFPLGMLSPFLPKDIVKLQGEYTSNTSFTLTPSEESLQLTAFGSQQLANLNAQIKQQSIQMEKLSWIGKTQLSKQADLALDLEGALKTTAMMFEQPETQVSLERFETDGKTSIQIQKDQPKVQLIQQLNLQVLKAQLAKQTLETQQLKGKLSSNINMGEKSEITVDYDNDLTLSAMAFKEEMLRVELAALGLLGSGQVLQKADQLTINPVQKVTLNKLNIAQAEQTVALSKADLQFKGPVELNEARVSVSQSPTFILQGLEVTTPQVLLKAQNTKWQGSLELAQQKTEKAPPEFEVAGELRTQGWQVSDPQQRIQMLELAALNTKVAVNSPQKVNVSQLVLDELKLAQLKADKKPLLLLKQARVSQLSLPNAKEVKLGDVVFSGLDVVAHLDDNNQPPQIVMLKKIMAKDQASETGIKEEVKQVPAENMPEEDAFQFSLASFKLGENSQIEVSTQAQEPKVHKKIVFKQFDIGSLDSVQKTLKTPVNIAMQVDDFTKLNIKGNVVPLQEKVSLDLEVLLSDLDLQPFSPFIQQQLGYVFKSGNLSTKSQIVVENNLLDAKNHITLKGFAMELGQEQKEAELQKNLAILDQEDNDVAEEGKPEDEQSEENKQAKEQALDPITLNYSLDLLRQKNGTIELDLPVKGQLDAPDFKLNDIINLALKNSLMSGSQAYLLHVLQPYGTMINVAKLAYETATAIRLDPVQFKEGSETAKQDMADYLAKIHTLLNEKPKLTLKVCGYTTEADEKLWLKNSKLNAEQLKQKHMKTAQARQLWVKKQLVSKGVESSRLTTCYPEIQKEDLTGVALSI